MARRGRDAGRHSQGHTTNGAELLRISKERGAISPGLFADIIAMPTDPLQDIESLRKINFVMKNGKIVRSQPQK